MSAPYQSDNSTTANRRPEGGYEFVPLGPDTLNPRPVDESFNNRMPSSNQQFAGFGNYAGTNAEPLLPAQGYQEQAPIFQEPGYDPTQGQIGAAAMNSYPIPEAHVMSSDAGGGDGYVFNHEAAQPPAGPQQVQLFDPALPRHLQPPSYVLESRPGDFRRYGTSPITVWQPHEFLPEDFPEPDPAYIAQDPNHPPRVSSPNVPAEAYIPGEIFRETNGTSIVEPQSVQAENGRLYNGYREGKYFLPNDPAEQDRLDLQHHGLKTLLGGRLYLAPIQDPKHVLDLATGTGIWPNEFAAQFPNAQIIGTDLSQIQPEHRPANVTFVREDSEEEWCYDVKFDYIHARAVFSCFDNPKGVMEKAFANMNPGGYIEYLDFFGVSGCLDGSIQGTAMEKVGVYCAQGATASGRDLLVAGHYKQWLEEVGFVDVVERKLAWPFGPWAKSPRLKEAGLFCQRDFYDGVEGIAHVMLQRAHLPREEIERYIAEVRDNLLDSTIHAYAPVIVIYGRKPTVGENAQGETGRQEQSVAMPPPPKPPTNQAGFAPNEMLAEDFPEIDPLYLKPDVVSPAEIPANQSGTPPEAWVPAEICRDSSGSSVIEPNSVVDRNGRSYHGYKEGKYMLPNDAAEQERLDMQHFSTTLLLHGKLYLAPIQQNPRCVLDIATGTGLWAMEFARAHPESRVIGTDLSKIQPENTPANVEFIRDDAEEPWEFGPATKFDFVHARAVFSCFDDPKSVMRQAFENMNPGGWIEYVDGTVDVASMDDTVQGTTLERWGNLMREGFALRGRDVDVTRHYKRWMEEIGFVDVQERKFAAPMGTWCKDERLKHIGRLFQRNLYDNIQGLVYRVLDALGHTEEQISEFADKFRADLVNPHIHGYMPVWCVFGRKPHEWEVKGECNDTDMTTA